MHNVPAARRHTMAGRPARKSRVRRLGRGGVALAVVLVCIAIATPVSAFVSHAVHTSWVSAGSNLSIKARCPAGQHVLFGGAVADPPAGLRGMHRTPDGAWAVDVDNS